MRIVVLGGGTVGTSVSEMLCDNRHSVTVVDVDAGNARRINDLIDVRAMTGSASQSSVLFQAGVAGADLCLAVTGVDEVNIVAASMAKAMGARRSIARVYAPVFRDLSTFDYQRHFGIDRLLSLEHLSAMELAHDIRNPGSVAVEYLARGELEVQELEIGKATAATGVPLHELELPRGVRVGSILRRGETWIAGANDRLEPGDRITLIGSRQIIDQVRERFRPGKATKVGVVIAGGGETGYHLAQLLEASRFAVVLMERDRERCEFLAKHLPHVTVVNDDGTSKTVQEEERVDSADVFVACTGDDENNIIAAVEAAEIGSSRVMAVVSRPDYASIVERLGIHHAVSPREVMAKQILGFLNEGPVISRSWLGEGGISVLEIEVLAEARATEHVLANLALPAHCLIAAVVKEDYVRVPTADDRLVPGDTVIVLVEDAHVQDAIAMFEVGRR